MSSFSEVLGQSKIPFRDVTVYLEDEQGDDVPVDVHVVRAPGLEWAALTAQFPARPDALVDLRFGFNIHDLVATEGHRWVTRKDGDELVPFGDDWAAFAEKVPGDDFGTIVDAVFMLNVWEPQQRRDRLGKQRQARSKKS